MRADWGQARLHSQCSLPTEPQPDAPTCSCCFRSKGTPIALCAHAKQLEPIGSGFPLYFSFLKYTLIMLLLMILSYSCLSLSWTIEHNKSFCISGETKIVGSEEIKCTSWMVLLARLEEDVDLGQNVLRATSFVIQLLFLLYMRDSLLRMQAYYQERRDPLSSDYAVMVTGIPAQRKVGAKLKHLVASIADVQKVVLVPQLGRYVELKEEAVHLEGQIRELAKQQGLQRQKGKYLTERLRKLYSQIDEEQSREKQAINNDESQCERAILILSTNAQRNALLTNPPNISAMQSIFSTQSLSFSAAPEPSEILWNNINASRAAKTRGLLVGWGLFIVLLGCVTCGFYFLLEFKSLQIEHALAIYKKFPDEARYNKLLATAVVLMSLLGVVLFNKLLLAGLLQAITRLEKHKTTASFELSFSIKYALGLFFTTAIMTLMVENIRFRNIYQHDFGVVQEETIMFLMNAVFVPLLWLVNPWYIAKRIKQFLHQDSSTYSQSEANQLMELPEYSLGKRYAEVAEWVWFTFLYASVIPVGACIMGVGLAAFYWVDKLNLLKKSSLKQKVGANLSVKAMAMLDLTLVLRPAGQLIFDSQMRGEWNYQSAICLVVGVVYLLLPLNKMLAMLHGEEFNSKTETYKEISDHLADSYERHHPLYLPHNRLNLFSQSSNLLYDALPITQAPSIQPAASFKLCVSQPADNQNPEAK